MGELEEKKTPPAETAAHTQEVAEEPQETDKMLEKKNDAAAPTEGAAKKDAKTSTPKSSKPNTPIAQLDKKSAGSRSSLVAGDVKRANGGEEIIDIPEDVDAKTMPSENEEKKISKEEREVKPKKIPIGGLKLPGFFMKTKPRAEGDGADGELLEKEPNKEEGNAATAEADIKLKKENEKPRNNFGERLRNFFARKADKQKQQAVAANGDADAKSEATAEASPADGAVEDEKVNAADNTNAAPPQKCGLLNAIKLPIANIIPKRRAANDVELGMGKAGLASMETLDDSLKDQDCVDKAVTKNNGTDEIGKIKKSASGEIKEDAAEEKNAERAAPLSFLQRLRNYRCSIDDGLITLGIFLLLLLLGVIFYVLSHEAPIISAPVREGRYIDAVTGCGMVEGLQEDGAFVFRGIPYALPPVGNYRWKAARGIEGIDDCWNDTLKAHNASQVCTQMLGNGTVVGDEDCLYLDIITPHIRYDRPLPVIVLVGADSLTGPSPGILRASPAITRKHDVIFVRPNFRLGAFGFLALDALTKDDYPHTSGNYGLSDLLAALNWINLNIIHFGGNPKSVILFGHRAGGTLVSALITSPQINGLYARAWVSSSSAIFPGKPLQESERRNLELPNALNCAEATCLRAATPEQIWSDTPDTWLHFPVDIPTVEENTTSAHHEWLVLDGIILQQHPADSWKTEIAREKPKLVMGTTAHESHTEKLRQRYANWTAQDVHDFLEASKIGALKLTNEAIRLYNATDYRALVSMITDIRTICPLLINARLQPLVPFYVVTQGTGDDELASVDVDVQAILGQIKPQTAKQRQFVSALQQLFYDYVRHGALSQYDPRRRVLNVGADIMPQEDHPNCNFWISNDIVPRYARVD